MAAMFDILSKWGKIGVEQIKTAVAPLSTTNETVNSVRDEVSGTPTSDTLKILGRPYFSTLETGRGPRKSAQEGGFKDNLEQYLKLKNLPTKKSKTGVTYYQIGPYWFSAKSLAWKINKEGDKTYREGGREVYSEVLAKFVEELKAAIREEYRSKFMVQIKTSFRNANNK